MFGGVSFLEVGQIKILVPDDCVPGPVKSGWCVIVEFEIAKAVVRQLVHLDWKIGCRMVSLRLMGVILQKRFLLNQVYNLAVKRAKSAKFVSLKVFRQKSNVRPLSQLLTFISLLRIWPILETAHGQAFLFFGRGNLEKHNDNNINNVN